MHNFLSKPFTKKPTQNCKKANKKYHCNYQYLGSLERDGKKESDKQIGMTWNRSQVEIKLFKSNKMDILSLDNNIRKLTGWILYDPVS